MRLPILLLAGMALIVGCDRKTRLEEATSDDNTQAPRRAADGSTTITVHTEKGESEVTQGGAAALPAGLAVYPGAVVGASTRITGDDPAGNGTILAFDTQDTPDQVIAFYKASALQAGYRIDGEVKLPTMMMLTARHPAKGGFTLTATAQGGKTAVTILGGAGRR